MNKKEWVKGRKKTFQIEDEILKGRNSNTGSLALSRKRDEDSLHDIYSEKKQNKLEKGEINSETEMDEISEGNEVSNVEIDEKLKEKKNKAL